MASGPHSCRNFGEFIAFKDAYWLLTWRSGNH